jgi:hypothetical protein
LNDETITSLQQAIAASIDRSLTLSAQFELSRRRDAEALFAYDVELSRLDAAASAALERALRGELDGMDDVVEGSAGGAAVRVVASAARDLRVRKTSWRINLLGLVNVASFTELVQQGTLTFDPVSGALTAADAVTSRRIRVDARPLESDSGKLREVLLQSLMVTAAYRASGSLGTAMSVTAGQTYLEQHGRANRPQLERHYRVLIGLGLCGEDERDARLATEHAFGASTFVVENRFDAAACDAMFLDGDGQPHRQEHFERIARLAFLALIPERDANESFRRLPLEADSTWSAVRNLGGDIGPALPAHIRQDPLSLARVTADIVTIVWWASAMSRSAKALAAMRTFLAGRTAEALAASDEFSSARRKLSDALGSVMSTTRALFDDPWDLLAMDTAASRRGDLDAAILSSRFAVRYSDGDGAAAAPLPAAGRTRGRPAVAAARPRGGAARPWTAEENAVFARHVINMRNGRLSTEGSVSSTADQVREIFDTHIPAYAARQRAAGVIPRVVFYAHGGLTGERDGLLPVLARRRFWELSGIYPVYFVWETGLLETVTDIIGIRRTRGAVSALSDLAIEAAARRGKAVWEQMKRSAESSAASGGGSRLLAECSAKLWADRGGDLEFHAIGHSAGSIMLAYFLPLLLAGRPRQSPAIAVRSLHFLAPAITNDFFKSALQKLIGPGKAIGHLTMYTMTDELERADHSMRPYGKSLLYLVRASFEPRTSMPLLGLQESLNRDLTLIRFFGLAGREKIADVIYSRSAPTAAPAERSESATHGGFDNDVATMTSVARRILGIPSDPVVDYFEEAIPGFDRDPVGAPAPVARRRAGAERAARKSWTVMVWTAGGGEPAEPIPLTDEWQRLDGGASSANLIVQAGGPGGEVTRYALRSGTPLEADVVARLGAARAGDAAVAADFLRWAVQAYPAERLIAIVRPGSRGKAWFEAAGSAGRGREIPDGQSLAFADAVALKRMLVRLKRDTGRTLDLLAFDGSRMNTIEIAYQLKGLVRFLTSTDPEVDEGSPYERTIDAIATGPAPTPAALAAAIGSGVDVDAAAADADALERLAAAARKAVRTTGEFVAVTRALHAASLAAAPDSVLLGPFCRELRKRSKVAAVRAAAAAVEKGPSGDARIYFPRGPVSRIYGTLDFAKTTGWGRFLVSYHKA